MRTYQDDSTHNLEYRSNDISFFFESYGFKVKSSKKCHNGLRIKNPKNGNKAWITRTLVYRHFDSPVNLRFMDTDKIVSYEEIIKELNE